MKGNWFSVRKWGKHWKLLSGLEWIYETYIRSTRSHFPHIDWLALQSHLPQNIAGSCQLREVIHFHYICGNHWVTSSTSNYDMTASLLEESCVLQLPIISCLWYRSPMRTVEEWKHTWTQIFLMCSIKLELYSDCRLYTVAFVLHTALGHKVQDIVFDQFQNEERINAPLLLVLPLPALEKGGSRSNYCFP